MARSPHVEPAVDRQVGPARERGAAQRHVLVVGAERRRATPRELGLRGLGTEAGPVGIHLVVVEDHRPRRDRVGALQVGIGLVLRVPPPVVGERPQLAALVAAHVPLPRRADLRALVEVVAQVQHQVGLLLGQPSVGREPALLVVGARGDREPCVPCPSTPRPAPCGSGRPATGGPPPGTGRSTRAPAPGRPTSTCTLCAQPGSATAYPPRTTRRNDASSATCQCTTTWRRGMPPSPSGSSGSRRQPGPEHHAGRPRVARRHPEGERLAQRPDSVGPLGRVAGRQRGEAGTEGGGDEPTEHLPSIEKDHVRLARGSASTAPRPRPRAASPSARPAASMARWPKNWLPSRGDCRRGESLPLEKTTSGPKVWSSSPSLRGKVSAASGPETNSQNGSKSVYAARSGE